MTSTQGAVSATTVRVGITYSSDANHYAQLLNPNAQTVDTTAVAKDIISHINAAGGVLGRRVQPVFYDEKIADEASNEDSADQAVCTAFTQDQRVAWAIINLANHVNNECMAKAKTSFWDVNTGDPMDQESVKPYLPYFHSPVMVDSGPYLRAWVDRLVALKYFTGWDPTTQSPSPASPVKVGVYYFDRPTDQRIYEQDLKPDLAAHGITVAADFAGDASPVTRAGQEQSAFLRFRSAGVTHLLVMGPMAFTAAEGQGKWHPRLGIGTHNQAGGGNPAYLKGAVGAGYAYATDVGGLAPGAPNPSNNVCLGWIKKDLHYDLSGQPGTAGYIQSVALCDAILVPIAAFKAAGAFDPAALQRGLSATHDKMPTAHTFSQGFTATHWSGSESMRDLVFDEGCKCFKYTSTVTRF